MAKFGVLLLAAGKSTRFGGREKKPFALLEGRPVFLRSTEHFVTRTEVVQSLLVIAADDEEFVKRRYGANLMFMTVSIIVGGPERHDSVANALAKLSPEVEFVAIHDTARPCVTTEQINAVFHAAKEHGAAVLAVPVTETVKRVDKQHTVTETVERAGLWLAQTPQVFRRDWITAAYEQRSKLGKTITDDAQLVEALGHQVRVVEGSPSNIKITRPADLYLAEAILKSQPKPKSSGPAHPFAAEAQW
jgi:2-C-methyl-D-erythritol 4-phosphate cytidylyltransferase